VGAIDIREVTPRDWKLWRDLRLRALQEAPGAYGSTYQRELGFVESDWASRLDGSAGPAVLALRAGEPVGMGAGFRDRGGWLHVVAMWTDPAHRSTGVGTAVLDHLVRWAAARDLRVHLDVAAANPRARTLYERAGFVATGETRPLRDGSVKMVERMVLAR